jgi:metal-responsive CopG/Arc/MetJ family transcriptional regulator
MGNTSVHIPQSLLEELDRSAAERGISRNRLIVEACQQVVRARHQWPEGFFSNARFATDELAELQGGADEFAAAIRRARRSRRRKPL